MTRNKLWDSPTFLLTCTLIVTIILILLRGLTYAKQPNPPPPAPPLHLCPLNNAQVIDGDCIRANIDLGWDISLLNQEIRLSGFDAWESARYRRTLRLTPKQWDTELIKGKAAKEALIKLLTTGKPYLRPDKDSAYSRRGGWLWIIEPDGDMIDVSHYMKEQGHDRTVQPK